MKRVAYLFALLLAVTPVVAVQVEGNRLVLSPEDIERCNTEGGCALITRAQFEAAIKKAIEQAKQQCGMRT